MIKNIAVKEWKERVREKSLLVSAFILVVLFLTGLFTSKASFEKEYDLREQAKAGIEENWLNQRDKNPHGAAHFGTFLFKPESRMALIDRGINRYAGTAFFVEGHVRNEAQFRSIEDETALVRFGELTPAYILIYLMPLMIILIGFNSFTGEKEGGTWRMVTSYGITARSLLFGKWLGITFTAMMLFIPLYLLMGITVGFLSGFGDFRVADFLLLGFVYLLFYLIFVNITLLVSWFSTSSGNSLICLLAIWMFVILVFPKLFVSASEILHPLPDTNTIMEMVTEARSGQIDGHTPASARELEKEIMELYGVERLEDLPFNFAGYRLQVGEEYDTKAYNYAFSHIRDKITKQETLISYGSFVSPFLPVRKLSMAFAGTDVSNHWNFSDAAEDYRQKFVLYLNEDLMYSSRTGETYFASSDVWASIPDFHYDLPATGEVFSAQIGNLIFLLGWLTLSFASLFTVNLNIGRYIDV